MRLTRLRHRLRRLGWRLFRPRTLGTKCLVLRGRELLLVRHSYEALWFLPGGGVEKGESFWDGARREVLEETGLAVERLSLFHLYHARAEGKDDHVALFVAEAPDGEPRPDGREVVAAGFFPLDALPPDASPATRRRVAEYLAGRAGGDRW